jgi:hypothetical protein
MSRALALLSEAQDIGLSTVNTSPETWEGCVDALRQIQTVSIEPEEELTAEGNGFEHLQRDRTILVEELRRVKDHLAAAEALASDHQGFSREGNMHLARLRSVQLFDQDLSNGMRVCPVCQSELSTEVLPAISEIEQSRQQFEAQVRVVEERSPQMDRVIRSLRERLESTKQQLRQTHHAFCLAQVVCVNKGRPVPRFLFIDQPSQVYFPADKDGDGSMEALESEDREAVVRIYRLALQVVQQLSPNFQIIMTDHADINQEWFQSRVIERWRGERELVPDAWVPR